MTGRGRLLGAALVASLALNGFLAAYVVVSLTQKHDALPPMSPRAALNAMADTMPKRDGDVLRAAVARHASELASAGAPLKAAQQAIAETISEPTVDPVALRAGLEGVRAGRNVAGGAFVSILADALPEISLETRLKIAETIASEKAME